MPFFDTVMGARLSSLIITTMSGYLHCVLASTNSLSSCSSAVIPVQPDQEQTEHDAVVDEDPEGALAEELEQEVDAEPADDPRGENADDEGAGRDRLDGGDGAPQQLLAVPGGGD